MDDSMVFYSFTRHAMIVLDVSDRSAYCWHCQRQIVELEAKNIDKVGTFKASVEQENHLHIMGSPRELDNVSLN
jgi:hypothetical protein